MKKLLNSSVVSSNPEYIALCNWPKHAPLREIVEELWAEFHPFADPQFPHRFAESLHQRFWEMYLAVQLLRKDVELVPKTRSQGPDIHIRIDGADAWIEAVAPHEGSGVDAVPQVEEKPRFEPLPEDKIILRFTNALVQKHQKYIQYLESQLIAPADPYVVGLNGRDIQMTIFEGPMPAAIKAVYPVGDYVVTFDPETGEIVSEGYQVRHEINKESGSPVPTNAFLDPSFSGVSGLLYSHAALWDFPASPGSELLYIQNSVAASPMPTAWLCGIREVTKEGNSLAIGRTAGCA